jgi:sialate O-acetylesterase
MISTVRCFGLCSFSALWLVVAAASPVQADVRLPSIIGDNMVLQKGQPLKFWGKADPGENVTVSLWRKQGGDAVAREVVTKADATGSWKLAVKPYHHAGPISVAIKGKNTINLKNVLIGEVWVCSGQSNMAWKVSSSNNAKEEIATAKFPKIRLYQAALTVAATPQDDVQGKWVECSPETIPNFSAVAYFFGRALHKKSGEPIGLVQTAWGGTPAESWTTAEMLESNSTFKPILDRWDGILANQDKSQKRYQDQLAAWREKSKKAKDAGKRAPRRPRPPMGPNHPHRPSTLYNGMINPLIPFAIKGAIWYQGESNASRAYQYRELFPAMIRSWRQSWHQGDFPFLFVQLANFKDVVDQPIESDWAELREAQAMTLSLPNIGQAVIIDIGEARDIHPKNKQDVGLRLSLAARRIAYDEDIVFSGPVYKKMTVKGNHVLLSFDHVGSGLVSKGDVLKGFAVAGKDNKFVWAEAKIKGNRIVVSSDEVPEPVAVRYAWANNPVCNLYNKEGLPASPFRTDHRPGVTVNNK